MGQMLKWQQCLHGGLVCNICYRVPCTHRRQKKVIGVEVFVCLFITLWFFETSLYMASPAAEIFQESVDH